MVVADGDGGEGAVEDTQHVSDFFRGDVQAVEFVGDFVGELVEGTVAVPLTTS